MPVDFPYEPLDRALELTKHLYDEHGGNCSVDELAESLGTTPKSGSFRQRLTAAKKFGLIERKPQVASISEWGRNALNPPTRDKALEEAFLNVPLYRQIYNSFRSDPLPATSGLDNRMCDLGVSPKSVDKIRRVFLKSATTAGFFNISSNRLVRPTAANDETAQEPPKSMGFGGKRDNPVLQAIWDNRPDESCDQKQFDEWFEVLRRAFAWIYELSESQQDDASYQYDEEPF